MLDAGATMIGCPSCAGCLSLAKGPHDHSQFQCSVGHTFSLWELYEAKETELERAQWSSVALLMHLRMILDMLSDASNFPEAPDASNIRQRVSQIQQDISTLQRMIDSTTLAARESRTGVQSENGGNVPV